MDLPGSLRNYRSLVRFQPWVRLVLCKLFTRIKENGYMLVGCDGRTTVFETVGLGSIPSMSTKNGAATTIWY